MIICPGCGTENLPQAKFCMQCGTPLAPAGTRASDLPTEERRVITVLFVDLVGFTERSDRADPEDVRRTLVPFHGRVKEDLERFGGTLDKFIGDAVMGVFGTPIAHEDDPVRAVRASMRILESMDELRRTVDPRLAVRIAVNTGEAVVAFGTGPQIGEAVAGDVVNTASRMQGLAPRDSVVVGATTLRAVRDLFETEPLPPATVKGKAEPLLVWRVTGARKEGSGSQPTAFVGRAPELATMAEAFEAATRTSSLRLLTVVGEPGIGKSRLVEEFRARAASRARWLVGRCLPYGETVTFAPAAATVRDVAGIEPADDGARADVKLAALAARVEPELTEREWLVSRLEPLLGIGPADADTTISIEEAAQAWSRIVDSVAADGPVVIQLDDLHWAEPVFLDLVRELAVALAARPVLLLCSARPELLERHPAWAEEHDGASTLPLGSLSRKDSAHLVSQLVSDDVLPAHVRESMLERAGGNPLYALEFARMVGEGTSEMEGVALPDTVQAVIAARLDAIPADLRILVQDAAVVGSSFWPGALAAMEDRQGPDVRAGIEALAERGVVRRSPASAFDSEPEYAFTHALIGEVAYGRIPRGRRAKRHLDAGGWIERLGGGRADERAEMLARHYANAVELAEAAGDADVAQSARQPAVRWLVAAGERATRMDADGAFVLFDRAVRIAPPGTRERAEALGLSARMGRRGGRLDPQEVLGRYEESLGMFRSLGDAVGTGRALTRVASQVGAIGDFARSRGLLAEAVRTLEAEPPGRDLARAYAYLAEAEMFAGDVRSSMDLAGRALALLGTEDHDELVSMSLHIRGDARCSLGDLRGLDDLREALRLAEASGNAADVVTSQDYMGEWLWAVEGPAAGLKHLEAALVVAERRGVVDQGLWTKAGGLEMLFDLGDWDRALQWCEDLFSVGEDRLDGTLFAVAAAIRSRVALYRGMPEQVDSPEDVAARARAVEEKQALAPALVVAAEMAARAGSLDDAIAYVHEFERATRDVASYYRESRLAAVARVCAEAGDVAPVESMIEASEGLIRRDRLNIASARAVVAELSGDAAAAALYAHAANGWRAFATPIEEAFALRGRARCLSSAGDDAADDERRARELFARLGVPT